MPRSTIASLFGGWNQVWIALEKKFPGLKAFQKSLHIQKATYQGKSKFEGNQICKILKNLHKLQEILLQDLLPFLHTFESLRKFKKACCGKVLKPNALKLIEEFETNYNILHEKFGLTIINKAHIIVDHVPDYLKETKHSLGQSTDQLIESCHQYVNKRFTNSNYKINNVESPIHGKKLLQGLHHINSYNSITK